MALDFFLNTRLVIFLLEEAFKVSLHGIAVWYLGCKWIMVMLEKNEKCSRGLICIRVTIFRHEGKKKKLLMCTQGRQLKTTLNIGVHCGDQENKLERSINILHNSAISH